MKLKRIKLARTAGSVRRYHTKFLLKDEQVSTHTFNMLNTLLILTDGNVSSNLLRAALMHDMGEYVTGDIPGNTKHAMDAETQYEIEELEQRAIDAIHPYSHPELSDWERMLLKLADRLDGLLKCNEELKMGNTLLADVRANYVEYLNSMKDKVGPHMWEIVEEAMDDY